MSHSRRRLRWNHEWRWGKRTGRQQFPRWSASIDLYGLNVPSIRIYGEGKDYAFAAIEYGSPGSDSVLRLEVNLEGTWVGRRVCDVAAGWRQLRYWKTGSYG